MKVNHVIVANFNVANMSFNAIRENKILAKISEFTVHNVFMHCKILCISLSTYNLARFKLTNLNPNI